MSVRKVEFILTADGRLLKDNVESAAAAIDKFNRYAEGMARALERADGGAARMNTLRAAVTDLGGVAKLSATQFEALKARVAGIVAAGAQIPPEFAKVERALRLDKGKAELAQFQARVKAVRDEISGKHLREDMSAIARAIAEIGGASKLSQTQLDQLRARLASLQAAGATVPKSLQGVLATPAPGRLQAAGASVASNVGQNLAGNLGAVGGTVGALGGPALAAAAGVGAVVGAVTAAAGIFAGWTRELIDSAGALTDLSAQTGISTTTLQEYAHIGGQVGVSQEQVAAAVQRASRVIAEGGQSARTALAQLGLSWQQLRGMAPDEQFARISTALRGVADAGSRAAIAQDLFGKDSTVLRVVLSDFEALREEAHALGLVLDQETVARFDDLGDQLTVLGEVSGRFGTSIVEMALGGVDAASAVRDLAVAVAEAGALARDSAGLFAEFYRTIITGSSVQDQVTQLREMILVLRAVQDSVGKKGLGATALDVARGRLEFEIGAPSSQRIANTTRAGGLFPTSEDTQAAARRLEQYLNALRGGMKSFFDDLAQRRSAQEGRFEGLFGPSAESVEIDVRRLADAWADMLHVSEPTAAQWAQAADKLQALRAQLTTEQWEAVREQVRGMGVDLDSLARKADVLSTRQLAGPTGTGLLGAGGPITLVAATREEKARVAAERAAAATRAAREESERWNSALAGLADAFQVLGIEADSTLGRILGGLTAAFAAGQRVKDLLARRNAAGDIVGQRSFGELKFSEQALVGLQGLQTAGSIFRSQNLLGGAASGAAFGAQIGGPMGAAIGAGAGFIVAGLGKLFGSDPVKKAQKKLGQEFGMGFTRELADAIQKQAKALGVSLKTAGLLSLTDIMAEGQTKGRSAGSFAGDVVELLQLTKDPKLAARALDEVGEAFGQVADEALKSGVIGSKALRSIIREARNLGAEVPEIKAFVGEQLSQAVEGVAAGVKGIRILTPEDAEAQASIAAVTFWAVFKEKGLLAAGDAFKEIAAKLRESIAALGGDTSAADALLGPIEAIVNLSGNELFRGAAEGAQGFAQTLAGLANADIPLTIGQLQAFGQQAQAAFKQAVEGGATSEQALLAIAPLLQALLQASESYGIVLDENTLALIDQAQASGIAFKTDGTDRLIQSIDALTVALGGVPPAIDKIGERLGALDGREVSVGVNVVGQGQFAEGQFDNGAFAETPGGIAQPGVTAAAGYGPRVLLRDTLFQAHAGEHVMIVPRGRHVNFRSAARGVFDAVAGAELPVSTEPRPPGGGGPPSGGAGAAGAGSGGTSTGGSPEAPAAVVVADLREQQHRTESLLADLISAVKDQARRPPGITLAPAVTINENGFNTQRDRLEFLREQEIALAKGIRKGQSAILDALRDIGLGV